MGRVVTIQGKNVQSRSTGIKKTRKVKPPRDKPIIPRKMPNTIYGEYRYHKRGPYRSVKGVLKRYLKCSKSATELACPGAGELDEEGNFQLTKSHVDGCKEPFLKERSLMREALFLKTKEKPSNPVDVFSCVSKDHQIAGQLTAYPEVKTSMLNWRNETLPSLPTHISEVADALQCDQWARELTYDMLIADAETGTVVDSTHRLQAWSVEMKRHSQRGQGIDYTEWHVVFGTPTFASKFTKQVSAYIDSTYDSVPNTEGAYQLLTLMIEYNGEVFPVAWCLMSRKTEEAYYEVLKVMVNRLLPGFQPLKVMTDFEDALQNAIQRVFPEADVKGCYFHHCHALLKNRQRFSVMTRVKKKDPQQLPAAYAFERDLMNLALLPPQFIREAFDQLAESLAQNPVLHEILGDFFDYYRAQWIQKKGPFSYSVYKETRRTNNVVERYHRRLKSLTSTRPEIVKFMIALKAVQEDAHRDVLLLDHGKKPYRNPDAKWTRKEQALHKAWECLGDLSACTIDVRNYRITTFLNAISPHTALAMDRGATEELTELHPNAVDIPFMNGEFEPMEIEENRIEFDDDASDLINAVDIQVDDRAVGSGSNLREVVDSEYSMQGKLTIDDHGEWMTKGPRSEREKSDDFEDETVETFVAYKCLMAEEIDSDYVGTEDTNRSFNSEAVKYADKNIDCEDLQYECFENKSEGFNPDKSNKLKCTSHDSCTDENAHLSQKRDRNPMSKGCDPNEPCRESKNFENMDGGSTEVHHDSENSKEGEDSSWNEDRPEDNRFQSDAPCTDENCCKTAHLNIDAPGMEEDRHKSEDLSNNGNWKSQDGDLIKVGHKNEKFESARHNDEARSQDCKIVGMGIDDGEIGSLNLRRESFTKSRPLATKSCVNFEMVNPSATKERILKTKQAIESYANITMTKPGKIKDSLENRSQAIKSHKNLEIASKLKLNAVREKISNNMKTKKEILGAAKPRVTNVTILKGTQAVQLRPSTFVAPTNSCAASATPMGVLWPIQLVANSSPHVIFDSQIVPGVTESPYFSNTITPMTKFRRVTNPVQSAQKGKQRTPYIPIPIAPKPPSIPQVVSSELIKQQGPRLIGNACSKKKVPGAKIHSLMPR